MGLISAIRAPRGRQLSCKGWQQEAALRMLHNNLDPEVAEKPDELIVYGGTGRAARDWPAFLGIDVVAPRVQRGVATGYCDRTAHNLDEALAILHRREPVSIGLVGNCADVLPELVRRGFVPDVVTDQTSAHDPLNGYVPNGLPLADAAVLRRRDPAEYQRRAVESIVTHVRAMVELRRGGAVAFD